MNTQSNVQVVETVKKVSKTTLAWSIFRAVMADETIPADQKRKEIKARFMSDAKITKAGCQTYLTICTDRASGKDPHIGRKNANKARSILLKGQQAETTVDSTPEVVAEEPVVEEVVQPTVDLSLRWLVGSDRDNITGSFKSRAEAQDFAKVNGTKWFDGSK